MVHSVSGWTRGMQVKLWDPWATRRYTNPRLPLLYLGREPVFGLGFGIHGLVGMIDNTQKLFVMLLNATTKCDANHSQFVKLLIARRSSAWLTLIVGCAAQIDSVASRMTAGDLHQNRMWSSSPPQFLHLISYPQPWTDWCCMAARRQDKNRPRRRDGTAFARSPSASDAGPTPTRPARVVAGGRRIVGRWLISNYSNIHHSTRIDPDFVSGRIGAAAAAAICMTHHQAPISLWAGKRYPSGTTRPPSVISSCPSVFSVPGNRLQLRLETFQYRNRSHVEVSTGAWVSVYLETLGRIWVSSSDRYKRQTERDKVMKDSQQVRCMALRMNVNMVLSSALLFDNCQSFIFHNLRVCISSFWYPQVILWNEYVYINKWMNYYSFTYIWRSTLTKKFVQACAIHSSIHSYAFQIRLIAHNIGAKRLHKLFWLWRLFIGCIREKGQQYIFCALCDVLGVTNSNALYFCKQHVERISTSFHESMLLLYLAKLNPR